MALAALIAERSDDGGEARLFNKIRGVFNRKPACLALTFFAPSLKLALHFEQVNQDFAELKVRFPALPIQILAERLLLHSALDTGLFERLLSRRLRICAALHWPALRNDPAPRLARGDQQDADLTSFVPADGERRDLGSWFGRAVLHRKSTAIAYVPAAIAAAAGIVNILATIIVPVRPQFTA